MPGHALLRLHTEAAPVRAASPQEVEGALTSVAACTIASPRLLSSRPISMLTCGARQVSEDHRSS